MSDSEATTSDVETTTVSEEGYAATSQVGDFDLSIDAAEEEGPNPNQVLVADYASCYLAAFRAGAKKAGHDDLGKVQIDASATENDDDDVDSVSFEVHVEADLDDGEFEEIVASADDICHVRSALKSDLHADVSVTGGAF